ncbi:MAG: hypothetical protein IJB57_04220 [Clostridia bacterium]|nr:hypothetical protein [Clostridia bacterium]
MIITLKRESFISQNNTVEMITDCFLTIEGGYADKGGFYSLVKRGEVLSFHRQQ